MEDKRVGQTPSETDVKKKKKRKPYVSIDTFLLTAAPLYGLTRVQKRGFKFHMKGRHYQRGEQVFNEELKKYLGK